MRCRESSNRLVAHYGYPESRVEAFDIVKLLSRSIERTGHFKKIDGRAVLYAKNTPPVSLIIFDGGHEMLSEYCFERLKEIAEQGAHRTGIPLRSIFASEFYVRQ